MESKTLSDKDIHCRQALQFYEDGLALGSKELTDKWYSEEEVNEKFIDKDKLKEIITKLTNLEEEGFTWIDAEELIKKLRLE